VPLFSMKSTLRWLPQALGIVGGVIAVWALVLGIAAQTEAATTTPTLTQLQSAASLDPWSAQLQYEIAQQELKQSSGSSSDTALQQSAIQSVQSAYKLDPWYQDMATLQAQMQIDQGQDAAALATLKVAMRDQPLLPNTYQNYMDLADSLATQALGKKESAAAKPYVDEAWSAYQAFLSKSAAVAKVAPPDLQMPATPAQLQLFAGEAGALAGHKTQAIALLQAAQAGGQTDAGLWLAALGQQVKGVTTSQYASESQWLKAAAALGN